MGRLMGSLLSGEKNINNTNTGIRQQVWVYAAWICSNVVNLFPLKRRIQMKCDVYFLKGITQTMDDDFKGWRTQWEQRSELVCRPPAATTAEQHKHFLSGATMRWTEEHLRVVWVTWEPKDGRT